MIAQTFIGGDNYILTAVGVIFLGFTMGFTVYCMGYLSTTFRKFVDK